MEIKIHSSIDLITNSSTEIFTYSKGCDTLLKELVNELFQFYNINKTFDEVFKTVILCEKYIYEEHFKNVFGDESPEGITEDNIGQIYDDVASGKIEKPDYFVKFEEYDGNYSCFEPSSYLHIIPKLPEYEKISKLLKKFLYSTHHEAVYNG